MSNDDVMQLCVDTAELSTMPYPQRQFIVIVEDKVVEAELETRKEGEKAEVRRKKEERKEALDDDPIWEDAFNKVRHATPKLDISSMSLVENVSEWRRSRDDKLRVLVLGYTTASSLIFPPGHPRYGVLYVAHPVLPKVYYTAAGFHRLTFEHKFSEALELLMALGANRVTVEHVSGWSRDFGVGGGTAFDVATAKGGRKLSRQSRVFFEAQLEGSKQPNLPPDLVWYPYEPTWHAIAEGRLKYGIKNFKLIIEYADDFNVNMELSLKASKLGLEVGGEFTDFQETVWHMDGEFPE